MLLWCACCDSMLRMLRVCRVFRARACMLCSVLLSSLLVSVGRPSFCALAAPLLFLPSSRLLPLCKVGYAVFVSCSLPVFFPSPFFLPPLFVDDHALSSFPACPFSHFVGCCFWSVFVPFSLPFSRLSFFFLFFFFVFFFVFFFFSFCPLASAVEC